MKSFWAHLLESEKKIGEATNLLICLDFDGTLAPITDRWQDAQLSQEMKAVLTSLASLSDTTLLIASGRSLSDIENRVGISNLNYAGNHGLEWLVEGKSEKSELPQNYLQMLAELKSHLQALTTAFPGVFLEDKGFILSVHYRLLPKNQIEHFTNSLAEIRETIDQDLISVLAGKKAYDFGPAASANKGTVCLYLEEILKRRTRKVVSIFIGDDTTDEYAFKALSIGITIRVGESSNSAATYFIKDQSEVLKVLQWITSTRRY